MLPSPAVPRRVRPGRATYTFPARTFGFPSSTHRITSYNVCYTKLLRIEEASRARQAAVEKLSAVEERIGRLAGEIEEMNRRMDGEAGEESRRLQEAALAEIRRVREQVEFAADQEVRKARQELRKEASMLSAKSYNFV